MSYEVIAIPNFKKEIKKLSKKYPSLKLEFAQLIETLQETPTASTHLGNSCYKIRMAIASKNKGKSGGSRIITHFKISHDTVYLLSIYDKSDKENISDNDLRELLYEIPD